MVPAAAGSSPVAHPSRIPANQGFPPRSRSPRIAHGDRFGDRCVCNYHRDHGGPGGDEPPIRFRGDEPELYLAFNHELVKSIARDVRATPEDIEDACSFAWIQFFRYQPDRDRNWKGWLYRTAQRETWRLNAERRGELQHRPGRRIARARDHEGAGRPARPARRAAGVRGRDAGAVAPAAALAAGGDRQLPGLEAGRRRRDPGRQPRPHQLPAAARQRAAERDGPSNATSSSGLSRHRARRACASSRTTRRSG